LLTSGSLAAHYCQFAHTLPDIKEEVKHLADIWLFPHSSSSTTTSSSWQPIAAVHTFFKFSKVSAEREREHINKTRR
jgi:hypothetical protein